MPRRARITLPHISHHIIQRGNNRQPCFYSEDDCRRYLNWLKTCSDESQCQVHAYVLMTNHVHLLVTPSDIKGLGQLMKNLGQRYAQYINRTYQRSGTLWEGRFRSCIAGEDDYVLACHRYIELNPVRAGMVSHPAEYPWSSYRANAQGEHDDVITQHPVYQRLARKDNERKKAYRELFRHQLAPIVIDDIRSATNGNYALGSDRFRKEIERTLGRRARRGKPGRPTTE